jgi:2-haloacid dehalogenase
MRLALITFDVYTALFDIESSLAPLVSTVLGDPGLSLTIVRAWRRKQLEYALLSNSLQQPRLAFETLTQRALDDTLARAKLTLTETDRSAWRATWLHLRPWPEAPTVLTTLKARGYTLGLLSNGDAAQLEALRQHLPDVFSWVFSSEQAGYYKPHPQIYALPLNALAVPAEAVWHVAGSPTDVLGAKAAGLKCLWSNREQQPILVIRRMTKCPISQAC